MKRLQLVNLGTTDAGRRMLAFFDSAGFWIEGNRATSHCGFKIFLLDFAAGSATRIQ